VLIADSTTGEGIEAVRAAAIGLRDRVAARQAGLPTGPMRLAIDRAFSVKGRGAVVTGTLGDGELRVGDRLRLEPDGTEVRVRGLQVHHEAVVPAGADHAGSRRRRTAGLAPHRPRSQARMRPAIGSRGAPAARPQGSARPSARQAGARRRAIVRLHVGTAAVDAQSAGEARGGLAARRTVTAMLGSSPVATFAGDRAVLRRPSPGDLVAA
jgi:selenocysteine-specific elongation factor